jgi:DnaD/phage-associated family protein
MSGLVMGLVWELPLRGEFGRAEKYILLAYADHSDQNGGNIFPSVDLVAEKTGYAERAVQMSTRTLEKLGFLVSCGFGPNGTNRWRIPVVRADGGAKIAPLPMSKNAPEGIAPPPMSENAPEGNAPEGNAPETIVVVKDSTATTAEVPKSDPDPTPEEPKPNIFKAYEQNFGMMTPMIADELRDFETTYPMEWIEYAMREAVTANARNLKYVAAVLKRIQLHGFDSKPNKTKQTKGRNHEKHQPDKPAENSSASPEDRAAAERVLARKRARAAQQGVPV